jgi:negative regulator of flagellin synthesis FlgM
MKVNQAGSQVAASTAKETKEAKAAKGAKKADAVGKSETSSARATKSTDDADKSARTEISGRAREMAKAKDVATTAPDVREEKIQELRRRMAEGKYKVDPNALADKIVDDHLSLPGA